MRISLLGAKMRIHQMPAPGGNEMRRPLAGLGIIRLDEGCGLVAAGVAVGAAENEVVLPEHAVDGAGVLFRDGDDVVVG